MNFFDALTNFQVLTVSWVKFLDEFGPHTPIICIMMVFTMVGAADKIQGNKLGYGEQFDAAFQAMGPLAISLVGIITLVPILELALAPLLMPVFELIGASPAMFAGILLPVDAGGYPLAAELAGSDSVSANFAGFIVGSTFGVIIIGQVPVALNIIEKRDWPYFACGVLMAIITIPLGCLAGGLAMNLTSFKAGIGYLVTNLIPLLMMTAVVAGGLYFKPTATMRAFNMLGAVMKVLLTASITLSILQFVTGLRLPLFRLMVEVDETTGLSPLTSSLLMVGQFALLLTGSLPMVTWISRTFRRPLAKLGNYLDLDELSCACLVASLASIFPALNSMKDMGAKGKVLNIAFAVCASYAFSDHISYPASLEPEMIIPTVIAKLTAGITALLLASRWYPTLMDRLMKKA